MDAHRIPKIAEYECANTGLESIFELRKRPPSQRGHNFLNRSFRKAEAEEKAENLRRLMVNIGGASNGKRAVL